MALSEEYYDLIMPYVPKEVKSVITNQRELIDRKIDEKVEAFSNELVEQIDLRSKEFYEKQTEAFRTELNKLEIDIDALLLKQVNGAAELKAAAANLKALNSKYKEELSGLGRNLRLAAFGVASSAGLRLPYGKINEFMDGSGDK